MLNIHEIWMLKLFYSRSTYSQKFLFWCMTVQAPIPQIFLQHIPQNHSQFQIMCMIIHSLRWGRHANVWLACNFKWDQLSWTFWLLLIFLLYSAPSKYTTKMQLCVPDELEILEHISEWGRTTNHHWCSHVFGLYDSFKLKKTSISGLPTEYDK